MKHWPADKVQRRPIEGLVPFARNARTHSEEQVAQVAASIREWGWTIPVLVDEAGTVIAGHCRLLAARQLGIEAVPVMVAKGWSEQQKAAYVLADNQLTLRGDWNFEALRGELRGLHEWGFDTGLTGFTESDFGAIAEGRLPGLEDGERGEFQQITFTLHDEQAEVVGEALRLAKARGEFDGPNQNSNGNALARICEEYLTAEVASA